MSDFWQKANLAFVTLVTVAFLAATMPGHPIV